jgi:hypothetical protein
MRQALDDNVQFASDTQLLFRHTDVSSKVEMQRMCSNIRSMNVVHVHRSSILDKTVITVTRYNPNSGPDRRTAGMPNDAI